MKIYQLLPTIAFGDAVGNDCIAINQILKSEGYETGIYAENIDTRLKEGVASRFSELKLNDIDVIAK